MNESLAEDFLLPFSHCFFLSDVHVELGKPVFGALLGYVFLGVLVASDSVPSYVWMIPLDVHVSWICKSKFVCVICDKMDMEVTVLMSLLTNAGFLELVGGVGPDLQFELF